MAERFFLDGKPVKDCRPHPSSEGQVLIVRGDCNDQEEVDATYTKKYIATRVGDQLVWAPDFR